VDEVDAIVVFLPLSKILANKNKAGKGERKKNNNSL
jgi:hypothetical protein